MLMVVLRTLFTSLCCDSLPLVRERALPYPGDVRVMFSISSRHWPVPKPIKIRSQVRIGPFNSRVCHESPASGRRYRIAGVFTHVQTPSVGLNFSFDVTSTLLLSLGPFIPPWLGKLHLLPPTWGLLLWPEDFCGSFRCLSNSSSIHRGQPHKMEVGTLRPQLPLSHG